MLFAFTVSSSVMMFLSCETYAGQEIICDVMDVGDTSENSIKSLMEDISCHFESKWQS